MTATEPVVEPRGLYSVMEASRLLGCDQRTLHKYARYFSEEPVINKVNRRSYFTGRQLLRIWRCSF